MIDFIANTLTNPYLFWPALEATATAVAAAIVIWQLRRLREETVAHRFEGFKYALELLSQPEYKDQATSFYKLLERGDPYQFKTSLPPLVHWILRTLQIVAHMISKGYLDEDLFFRVEGLRLANLALHIRLMEEGRDTPRFESQISLFPDGRALLTRAEDWVKRNGFAPDD